MRRILSFGLMGLMAAGSFAALAAAPQDTTAKPALTGNAEKGKALFAKAGCYQCHGSDAQGAAAGSVPEPYRFGPRLGPNPMPLRSLTNYVRKPTGPMPPYTATVISDQDLADIHAFLQSRPQPVALEMIPTFEKRR